MAGPQGLQKQVISIPMGGGLDTKNNPVLVNNQKLTLISNAKFVKGTAAPGQLQPRNGFADNLGDAIAGGGTIANATAIATLNDEIDIIAGGNLYAYSLSQGSWVLRGPATACVPSVSPIVRGNFNQSLPPDAATLNGVTVYSWIDSRGGVWAKVVDQDTGTVLQAEAQLDATGTTPRVIALATPATITVLWAKADGHIAQAVYSTNAATGAPGTGNIQGGTLANTPFEVAFNSTDDTVGVVFLDTSSHVFVHTFSDVWAGIASSGSLRSVAINTITITVDGNDSWAVASQVSGTGNQTMYVDFLDHATLASVATYNHAVDAGPITTIAPSLSTTTTVIVYTQQDLSKNANTGRVVSGGGITQISWDEVTGYGGQSAFLYGMALASAPFVRSGVTYLLVTNPSSVQPTYFLVNDSGTVVGRYVSLNAGAPPSQTGQRLTHVSHVGILLSGPDIMAIAVETTFESQSGKPVIVTGLSVLSLDFSQTNYSKGQLGGDLTLSGGLPQLYDSGSHLRERIQPLSGGTCCYAAE